jgi:hypothetical protein
VCQRTTFVHWNFIWNGTENLLGQVLVAPACNPTYLGGWDQEDHSLRPAHANSSRDPHL